MATISTYVRCPVGRRADSPLQIESCTRRIDQRIVGGINWFFSSDTPIFFAGGSGATTPANKPARLWGGTKDQTTLDLTHHAYVIFCKVGDGQLWFAAQEDFAAIAAGHDVGRIAWVDSHHDLVPRFGRPKSPCLGTEPTIQLVAGANVWGTATDSTNGTVDGPFGTNLLSSPTGGVFGPDGKLYFIDAGTEFIRQFDPESGVVTTTVVSRDMNARLFNPPGFSAGISPVFALGPDGVFYFFVNSNDDTNTQGILSSLPDNSPGPTIFHNDFLTPLLGQTSNMYVAPDNSVLYVPCPSVGYSSGAFAVTPYQVIAIPIGTEDTGSPFAGNTGIPTLVGSGNDNNQGESVAALSAELGNSLNCYVAPNGDLYTLCNASRMVRRVDHTNGQITSVTNHQPVIASGAFFVTPQAGGYSGDGLAAFTLNDNTPQFNGINSVSVDPCGNVFINDDQFGFVGGLTHTALVRYVDLAGTLHTLAGQLPDVANNFPDATPVDALSRTIYDSSWLAWGPDGALYITSASCDFANYSANAIYRIASS